MKNLIVGSLIALAASQAAGCIITSGDDTAEDAHVSATWQLKSIATNTTATCPPGYDTVALFNQAVDGNDNPIGSCSSLGNNNESTCFVDLFDCADGAGLSFPLPPTRYKTWIQVMDHPAAQLYAASIPAYVDITNVDKNYGAQILVDGGYFFFDWQLVDATNGAPLTCAQAGAAGGVESIATDVNTPSNSATDQFDCEQGAAYTAGFKAATYTVSVAALNSAEQALGAPVNLTNKPIPERNGVTDLGSLMLPID